MFSGRRGNLEQTATNPMDFRNAFIHKDLFLESLNLGLCFWLRKLVFSPKGRANLIDNNIKDDVYKYIIGIIKGCNQKPMIINGMPDHIHVFVGFSPNIYYLIWFVI